MRFLVWLLLLAPPVWAAGNDVPNDPAAWLDQVALATRQTDYEGVFVYQRQSGMEIAHISHRFDHDGEIARLDALSGAPRTFLRENGTVYCYIPNGHHFNIERHRHRPMFPEILPYPTTPLTEFYQLHFLGHLNIAGHDSIGLSLIPRDAWRYGYALWADSKTMVLLRLIKLDAHEQPAAQFSFTQIELGSAPDRAQFRTGLNDKRPIVLPEHEAPAPTTWHVDKLPPGFHLVTVTRLDLPDNSRTVTHLVYSDGMATVSLFIEALAPNDQLRQHGLAEHGAMTLYTRPQGNDQITALGEVPPATLMMMADSIQPEKAK